MTESTASFAQLDLPPTLLKALASAGYESPSPIQLACIPPLLNGHDLLGEAQTGTGKTAAFSLPILTRLDLANRKPQALILTPTRELAIQVAEALQKYAAYLPDFHVLPLYGGQSMVIQLRQLSRGAHIIVGTPGRIIDHLERKSLKLDTLKTVVLDEADEMLRMGFIDDVELILSHAPSERQTALFSATMPAAIRAVAHRHLKAPQEIKIRTATATVSKIRQRYWLVRGVDKLDALTRILDAEESLDAAIVFVRTKLATEELASRLAARGHSASALNGDMTQGLREQVIEQLKSGDIDIVIATDVAARGLDVPRISHVINYDIPYDTEAYIHRIGRTGRAGREGVAILFVSPRETRMLKSIERATRQPIEAISLPSREIVSNLRINQFTQQIFSTLENEDLGFFMDITNRLVEEKGFDIHEIAAALALLAQRDRPLQVEEKGQGWAIATSEHTETGRNTSYNKEGRGQRPQHDRRDSTFSSPRRTTPISGQLARYRIEVGRNHNVTPKEIVGAIANEGGIEGRQIGQIHLFDDYSTIELPAQLPSRLLNQLKRIRVRQRPININAVGENHEKSRAHSSKPKGLSTQNKRGISHSKPPSKKQDR